MKIRTTMQPWLELEVSEAEYLDLQRQGLLLQGHTERAVRAAAGSKPGPEGKDTEVIAEENQQ